ncbi:two-component system, chemotaxis family, response regulator CheY [Noviherbaspirillum humi]|uniref:Two-component system, chemotaxis family, response regulator CheY n=1 Tax=Noviherbaspirillum humi TaxID=1688639 RepID=A0A239LRA2_9BURK|nr:response regulator [Noviherbaspirillum humi]SNT32408.1 two-component system, chemotaxis family, response regulator CheY [Noviherbaspirillum humi]
MLRILIADSSLTARKTLASVLENASCEVVGEANTAAHCLSLAAALNPQIICVDPTFSDRSDAGLLAELHAQQPKAVILVLSGGMDEAMVKTALASGVAGFIVKPYSADKVLTALRAAVLKVVKQART